MAKVSAFTKNKTRVRKAKNQAAKRAALKAIIMNRELNLAISARSLVLLNQAGKGIIHVRYY